MLEINKLSVYLNSTPVLTNISFQAKPGEILGIIGPNGAGKTTLLRAISGVIPTSHSQITLQGKSLFEGSVIEKAKSITVVPQVSYLPLAFTVWDVVMMGRTPYLNWLGQTSTKDNEIVKVCLKRTLTLNLSERSINQLSAGEQQRVLLARALAQTTPVLLMDEPTTHLDLRYQIELLDLVQKLTNEDWLITIIVLHDLNLAARYSNKLLLLHQGKVIKYGNTMEVLKESILTQVYQLSINVSKDDQSKVPRIFPK